MPQAAVLRSFCLKLDNDSVSTVNTEWKTEWDAVCSPVMKPEVEQSLRTVLIPSDRPGRHRVLGGGDFEKETQGTRPGQDSSKKTVAAE
ncbi:hypothetical protein H920_14235 [Fukomys damarensis]|uniref:Uncharacterized protein n=1 Tax=Fukomys damarensis TaxID=885580 RepID=A0A091D0B7_FUKDA|nr:hypothetical protein H920_14235 [Fukomys damarensis]